MAKAVSTLVSNIFAYILYTPLMALAWTLILGQASLERFIVGLFGGLAILLLLGPNLPPVKWARLPDQLIALVIYVFLLLRDITLSSLDVARRVLSRDMRLQPGIIAITTQDPEHSRAILALSADYITLTPGELVVEVENNSTMYIHCLDVGVSSKSLEPMQTRRLALLRRILGRPS